MSFLQGSAPHRVLEIAEALSNAGNGGEKARCTGTRQEMLTYRVSFLLLPSHQNHQKIV